jgi:predicted alpha/beta superfamily hydrolase
LIVLFIVLCALPAAAHREHTLTGIFRTHTQFHSQFLVRDRDILVYLPPDYDHETNRRYPVLYMQDGQNLFDGATSYIPGQEWRADETAQELILAHEIQPLIIVGIYNGGDWRVAEYTPTQGRYHGGQADRYGLMLTQELKPFIDHHYRTLLDAANTGLGGSSLGGLVALHLGLKHPHTFGKVAVVSPSVWWDDRSIVYEVERLTARPHLRIWLDTGTREGEERLWKSHVEDTHALRDALIARGWHPGRDFKYLEVEGAEHNERAWAERFGAILKFLYPYR